jgi:hypothetical protein
MAIDRAVSGRKFRVVKMISADAKSTPIYSLVVVQSQAFGVMRAIYSLWRYKRMFDAARKMSQHSRKKKSRRIGFNSSQNNSVVTVTGVRKHEHCVLLSTVIKMKHLIMSMMLTVAALAAHADTRVVVSEATLATAVAQSQDTIIKGVTWRCEDTKCSGPAWSGVDSFIKRYSTVSAAVGPLASFRSGGRAADKSEIATCNRLAGKY